MFKDYTVDDLIFYAGLFGGIMITYFLTEPLGWPGIARLIVGVVVGAGLGWVFLQLFAKRKNSGDGPPQDI